MTHLEQPGPYCIPKSVLIAATAHAWLTTIEDATKRKPKRDTSGPRVPYRAHPAASPLAPRRGRRASRGKGIAPTTARRIRRRRRPIAPATN